MRAAALDGLDDFAGLETARTDVVAGRLAVEDEPDALQVRVEAALRGDHGVRPVVASRGLLPADGTDSGHAAAECSTGPTDAQGSCDRDSGRLKRSAPPQAGDPSGGNPLLRIPAREQT